MNQQTHAQIYSSSVLTIFFFLTAGITALCSLILLFSPIPLIFIPVAGMSYIVYLIGAQRTVKFKINDDIFLKRLLIFSYLVAGTGCISSLIATGTL